MSGPQIVYAIALAGLFWHSGPSFTAWVLLGNMLAALLGCLALDLDWLGRADTTLTMMLIDFVSGSLLLTRPGLPRAIAVGYGITIPVYALSIIFSVSESTTFAVVIAIGLVQIMVAGIGADSDDRGGRNRYPDVGGPVPSSGGNHGMAQGGLAQSADLLSPNHRG